MSRSRTILAFDYGARRIGVAVGNTITRTARPLRTVSEPVVARRFGRIGELLTLTEQLPGPEGAWILGCLLHLAGAEDGARYGWQYAAGAGDRGASYCLSLHHRARGDDRAADF